MKANLFSKVKISEKNPKWSKAISRIEPIYDRPKEIRSEFTRDYNRILHCTAYRRLKHKTQVFFAPQNDHICTRIEHVNHVASVSYTISNYIGLNTELTTAIALGHDLGHAPFGHAGEEIIEKITKKELGETFWHEKNSLRFVDKLETLPDPDDKEQNLNLTYAVRDGIICHCGEVNEKELFPRQNLLDLNKIKTAGKTFPYTWEGCVVKIADKISYLGRDIEDALRIRILPPYKIKEIKRIIGETSKISLKELNNTILMHNFIGDLCSSSSPKKGLQFSGHYLELMDSLNKFNHKNIYYHERLQMYREYAKLIIYSIYNTLKKYYSKKDTLKELIRERKLYLLLIDDFIDWLLKYSNLRGKYLDYIASISKNLATRTKKYKNVIVYDINSKKNYLKAIIDFISGMTDSYAIRLFHELTSF